MVRGLRIALATFVVAGVAAAAAVAGGNGAGKFDLLGPNGNAWCDGSGVISGTAGDYGFAVINAPADGTVHATVSIKGQQPNTTYQIRLIQGIGDCWTPDATVTTNGQGNATVYWSEPSVSSHAFVAVDPASYFGPYFVTATYNY